MTRKERSEESAGSGAGRWRERDRKRERETRGALYETVGTRGSETGEGLGPTGGMEEGGIRWGSAARESDVAEEKEKKGRRRRPNGCDTRVGVGDRTQCPSCSLAILSSLTRESLTNARFLLLSLSPPFSLLFYWSRGILFYDHLQGGTCRGTASGITHRGRTVPPFFRTKRTVSQPDATQLAA